MTQRPRLIVCALESPDDVELVKMYNWRRAVPGLKDIYVAGEFEKWDLKRSQNFTINRLPKANKNDLVAQADIYDTLWQESTRPLALVIPAAAMNVWLQRMLHTRVAFDAAGVLEIEHWPTKGVQTFKPRVLRVPARKA